MLLIERVNQQELIIHVRIVAIEDEIDDEIDYDELDVIHKNLALTEPFKIVFRILCNYTRSNYLKKQSREIIVYGIIHGIFIPLK